MSKLNQTQRKFIIERIRKAGNDHLEEMWEDALTNQVPTSIKELCHPSSPIYHNELSAALCKPTPAKSYEVCGERYVIQRERDITGKDKLFDDAWYLEQITTGKAEFVRKDSSGDFRFKFPAVAAEIAALKKKHYAQFKKDRAAVIKAWESVRNKVVKFNDYMHNVVEPQVMLADTAGAEKLMEDLNKKLLSVLK